MVSNPRATRVTFVPDPTGDRLQTSMKLGDQDLNSSWPIGDQDSIKSLLDRLMVRVQEVTYISTAHEAEIQVMLEIGPHRYVARFPVDETSSDLKPELDRLMDEVTRRWINGLQGLLGDSSRS